MLNYLKKNGKIAYMNTESLVTLAFLRLEKKNKSLQYYDFINSLCDKYYQDYFEDWETDPLQKIKLTSKSKRVGMLVDFNRVLIVSENQEFTEEILSQGIKFSKEYCDELNVKNLEQMGVRQLTIKPFSEDFSTIVQKLQRNYYPKSEKLEEIFGKEYSDVALAINFERYGFHGEMNTGPVTTEEVISRLQDKTFFLQEYSNKLPKNSLIVDLALSKKNAQVEAFSIGIEDAYSKINELTESILEHSLSSHGS